MISSLRLALPCLALPLALSLSSTAFAAPPADEDVPAEAEKAPDDDIEPAEDEPAEENISGDPPVDPRGPKHSLVYTSLLAARINPLGLEERLWMGYQYRLYDKDKTILNGSNLGLFIRPLVSPAMVLIGPTIQVQPAAVLRLRATYSYVQYFGTFQYFQSYQSPHDDFSQTRLDIQADNEENYAVGGQQVELEALVQIKVKSLAIRSTTAGFYNHFSPDNMRGDDDLFYSVRYDALVPARGWFLTNDTDVLWLQQLKGHRNATLIAGARASTVMPFYSDDLYEPGESTDNPNGPQFRLGPSLGYIFYDRPGRYPRFNKPTLLLLSQWNVKHRWRTGRDISTALPTIAIVFAFSGQLWSKDKG